MKQWLERSEVDLITNLECAHGISHESMVQIYSTVRNSTLEVIKSVITTKQVEKEGFITRIELDALKLKTKIKNNVKKHSPQRDQGNNEEANCHT